MLVLFETPAGFALFKVLDEGRLDKVEDLWKEFQTAESARKIVKLKAFSKFENTAEALGAATHLVESKPSKGLRKFLKAQCQGETLAVADSKLGNAIKEKLQIDCLHNNTVMELMRGLRSQISELITGLTNQDLAPMSLGLSHSLSRYKLKFSPDKVDTMIIQAIGLLDDLDKELNTYAMRVREWYGWHFPELSKIIQDNIQYAKTVKFMGSRTNAVNLDFSGILPEEVESELKEAAVVSMGTEVSEQDMVNIKALCDQVISLSEYRGQLYDYLRSRMSAIAPNLTVLVGELVGARLIAHAGSLVNLAKHPASTVQILGAEKALFRALKTKHQTPKYGIIYHASLVGQAPLKLKGKISRSLAAKSALSIRYDALGDSQDASIGFESRARMEARLRQLEGKALGRMSSTSKGKPKIEPYDKNRKQAAPSLLTAAKTYNPTADSTLGATKPDTKIEGKKKKKESQPAEAETVLQTRLPEQVAEEPVKKKKKERREEGQPAEAEIVLQTRLPEQVAEEPVKKKKKERREEGQPAEAEIVLQTRLPEQVAEEPVKKKKKKERQGQAGELLSLSATIDAVEEQPTKRKKKSKEKHLTAEDSEKSKERLADAAAGTVEELLGSKPKSNKKRKVETEDQAAGLVSTEKKKKKKKQEELSS